MGNRKTHLLGRIAARCRDNGGGLAIIDGQCAVTYAELDAAADDLAIGLQAVGVGRGDLVCVMGQRSADFPVEVFIDAMAVRFPLKAEARRADLLGMIEPCVDDAPRARWPLPARDAGGGEDQPGVRHPDERRGLPAFVDRRGRRRGIDERKHADSSFCYIEEIVL